MKGKRIAAAVLAALTLLLFAACAEGNPSQGAAGGTLIDLTPLSISEQYQKALEITQNFDSYSGQRIHAQGTYRYQTYHFLVITDVTLCCSAAFEFLYSGVIPPDGTNVSITGTLGYYSDGTGDYPYINVESLVKL